MLLNPLGTRDHFLLRRYGIIPSRHNKLKKQYQICIEHISIKASHGYYINQI